MFCFLVFSHCRCNSLVSFSDLNKYEVLSGNTAASFNYSIDNLLVLVLSIIGATCFNLKFGKTVYG